MPAAAHPILWKALPLAAVAGLSVWATHLLIQATTPHSPTSPPAALAPPAAPLPFLQQWCFDCHGDGASKGDFAMDATEPLTEIQWDKIRRHVLLRTMPPDDKPSPPAATREAFERSLLTWQASLPDKSGTPRFRRLNRREFSNSLDDLLGLAPALGDLPEEETAHGFDNNADLQPLPPAALERYVTVTRDTVRRALLPAPVPASVRRYLPTEFTGSGGPSPDAEIQHETESADPVHVAITLSAAGSYRFTLRAYAHQAGDEPVQVALMDSAPQPLRAIQRSRPGELSALVDLPAGASTLSFRLVNPFNDPTHRDPHRRTRRLLVQNIYLEGPLEGDTSPTPSFIQRFGRLPAPKASRGERIRWAGQALDTFGRRAWRRPLAPDESLRLTTLAGEAMAHGLRDDQALTIAIEAILTSPHFLFLPDPVQSDPAQRAYASAARLSYLLWSTLPDETLLTECQSPWTPARLAATTRRLLADPRAAAFARNFAGQWLQLRNTTAARPDRTLFPHASPEIRDAMQQSSEAFFLHLVRENEPLLRLLDADYAFLNAPLAAWSGLKELPADGGFKRVMISDPNRRGLLGQPAVLMFTSYPNRTSPVLRGKYILEALLGLEPPPPPPNIPTLEPKAAGPGPPSVRAALERHRTDPACAACHRAIDPLGFPLEAFDAVGRPAGTPVQDQMATTFTGAVLHQPVDLMEWLIREQGGRIVNHTAERLMTYALGRGLTAAEKQMAHRLVEQCGGRQARFRDLLIAIITTPVFRGEVPSMPQSSQ